MTTPSPAVCPIFCPHVSVKRIADWGANAVKILLYYSPFDDAQVNDIKHAFIERIGAECEEIQIPFFCEFVGYDPKGGDEKGLEFAKLKPQVVIGSMQEFSKPQYKIDVLKVEVPINANYVEGSSVYKGQKAYSRSEALDLFRKAAGRGEEAVHLFKRGRGECAVCRRADDGGRGGHGLFGRAVWPRDVEGRDSDLRQARREGAGGLARHRGREEHRSGECGHQAGQAVVGEGGRGRA